MPSIVSAPAVLADVRDVAVESASEMSMIENVKDEKTMNVEFKVFFSNCEYNNQQRLVQITLTARVHFHIPTVKHPLSQTTNKN